MSGDALLLLPGHMCDERLWRDLRFAGRPVAHADLTRDDRIEAMARRALSEAPDRFVAVGFSMGGIVAMAIARTAPERLAALVLIDTNPAPASPARSAAWLEQQDKVRGGALRNIVAEELKPNYLSTANGGRADILRLTLDMAIGLGPDVFVRQSEALRLRADARSALPEIAVPTLVACGADDSLCPPDWHREMASAIPEAELAIVPDAGHLLPLERPAQLSAALRHFFDRIDGGSR